jgi:GNAT superfamily N-acetyltransferase
MAGLDHLIVRRATPADLEVLVDFSTAMAVETEGRHLDRDRLRAGTRAVFESPARGFYVVAEVPGAKPHSVVGQLLVTYEWSDWRNGSFWWIQSVYVDPAWRRRGVFRRMHEHILRETRARGDVCGMRLYVESANTVAQTAYRRVGLATTTYRVCEQDFVFGVDVTAGRGKPGANAKDGGAG